MGVAARWFAALTCLLVACAANDENAPPVKSTNRRAIVLRENTARAPQAVADATVVAPEQITIPVSKTASSWIATLKPGTVIAGNRDTTSNLDESSNPYGFLRKVVSISKTKSEIVVKTAPAYLDELIEEGDLVFGRPGGTSIFDDGQGIRTKTLQPLANGASDDGVFNIPLAIELKQGPAYIKITNGKFDLGAKFEGEIRFTEFLGAKIGLDKSWAKFSLDPSASVDIEFGGRVDSSPPKGTPNPLKPEWKGPEYKVPLPAPIPVTLNVQPKIVCGVDVIGEIAVHGTATLTGHSSAGLEFTPPFTLTPTGDPPTATPGFEVTKVTGKATVHGECAIQASIKVLAFDAAGIEGTVGPYVAVDATACATAGQTSSTAGFTLSYDYGLRADISAVAELPIIHEPSWKVPLASFKPINFGPTYLYGDAKTCEPPPIPDSCAHRADGLYCSSQTTNTAYFCKGGSTAGGQQCPTPQKCKGSTTTPIAGGKIICG